MELSTLKFSENHCIRNVSKGIILAGWRWIYAAHPFCWQTLQVKNKAGLREISGSVEISIQDQRAWKTRHILGVRVQLCEWDFRKLRTAHLHWQWFCFCRETRKRRSGACIFFWTSLTYWKWGKQNHASISTTEAEFHALLEGLTECEFLKDVIHFA